MTQKAAPVPAGLAFGARIADKLVLGKIRHALGKRFRFAVSAVLRSRATWPSSSGERA